MTPSRPGCRLSLGRASWLTFCVRRLGFVRVWPVVVTDDEIRPPTTFVTHHPVIGPIVDAGCAGRGRRRTRRWSTTAALRLRLDWFWFIHGFECRPRSPSGGSGSALRCAAGHWLRLCASPFEPFRPERLLWLELRRGLLLPLHRMAGSRAHNAVWHSAAQQGAGANCRIASQLYS